MQRFLFGLWLGLSYYSQFSDSIADDQQPEHPPPAVESCVQLVGRYEFATECFVDDIKCLPAFGRLAAVSSDLNEPLTFWNLKTKACSKVNSPKTRGFGGMVSVSGDRHRIATNVTDGVCIVDAENGTVLKTLTLPKSIPMISTMALNSNGSKILMVCLTSDYQSQKLRLMDLEREEIVAEKTLEDTRILYLSFGLDDSSILASGIKGKGLSSYGSPLIRWKFETDTVRELTDTTRKQNVAAFQEMAGDRVATVMYFKDKEQPNPEVHYVVWDASDSRELVRIGLDPRDQSFSFSNDGRRLVGIADGKAVVTDLNESATAIQSSYRFDSHGMHQIRKNHLSPDGEELFLALDSGTIQHWHLPRDDSKPVVQPVAYRTSTGPIPPVALDVPMNVRFRRVDLSNNRISTFALLDEETIVMSSNLGDISIHRWETGEILSSERPSERKDLSLEPRLAASSDGKSFLLATGRFHRNGDRFEVRGSCGVWEREPLRQKQVLPGLNSMATAVAMSPDGKWAAAGGDQQEIIVWDLTTGIAHFRALPKGGTDRLKCIALEFSADSEFLIAATDKGLTQWSLADKTQVRQPGFHSQRILCRRPEHANEMLCTTRSGLIMRTLPELAALPWNMDVTANFASFSKDGNRLAIYGQNGLTVIDCQQGKSLLDRKTPKCVIQPMLISPDGRTVMVAMGGHLVLIPVDE